jgi:hypothetical protein
MNGDVVHAYLGYNIGAIQQQLMGIASLIVEILGKSTSLILHILLITQFPA